MRRSNLVGLGLIGLFATLALASCSSKDTSSGNPGANDWTPPETQSPSPSNRCSTRALNAPTVIPALVRDESFDQTFTDVDGSTWTRHGRTESVNGRRLLLVIDAPEDIRKLQKVIFRKSFAKDEMADFDLALRELKDPSHPVSSSFMSSVSESLVPAQHSLWPITHQWDAQTETQYNEWVHTQVTTTLLEGSGLHVDCADFAMSIRWIYAHDHGLPAADTLEGTGRLFGSWQSTSAWDALPTNADWHKDERFKAALKYILENSYTHSIVNDLYPVSISPNTITPGTVYLTWHGESGHTRTYLSVGHDPQCQTAAPCFVEIFGNEPKSELGYVFSFENPERQEEGTGGLMRFRWPVMNSRGDWSLAAAASMPGYSREQYLWNDIEFLYNIGDRLALFATHEELVASLGYNISSLVDQRMRATLVGYYVCALVPCAAGSPEDEKYSTPNRDQRLVRSLIDMKTVLGQVDGSSLPITTMKSFLQMPLLADFPETAWSLIQNSSALHWDANPRDDFASRWGLGSLTPVAQAHLLSNVMFSNWMARSSSVDFAVRLCTTADHVADCKPGGRFWDMIQTARLDQGFRVALKNLRKLHASLTAPDRAEIENALKAMNTQLPFCDGGCASPCTMYDFVIAHPEHIEKMTSDLFDTEAHRYGF